MYDDECTRLIVAVYDAGYNNRLNERDYDPLGSNISCSVIEQISLIKEQRDDLLDALKHLEHNARKSGANMGAALDVAYEAIAKATSK